MDFLSPGEKIYLKFRASRRFPYILKYFVAAILMFLLTGLFFMDAFGFLSTQGIYKAVFTALAFFSGVSFFVTGELKREKMGTYYITNYRVVMTKGILGTKMDAVSYGMIVNVKLSQSFAEKIFGLGNIEISTARGHKEILMIAIPNPRKVEQYIYQFLEGTGPDQSLRQTVKQRARRPQPGQRRQQRRRYYRR